MCVNTNPNRKVLTIEKYLLIYTYLGLLINYKLEMHQYDTGIRHWDIYRSNVLVSESASKKITRTDT